MSRRPRLLFLAALACLAGTSLLAPSSSAADPSNGETMGGREVKATVVTNGPRDRRVVALTFDDGYAPWNVRRILRILEDEAVPATFFLNGIYLQRDPALWQGFGRTGHAVGNHTYMHEDATRMTAAELVADLRRNRRVVEAAIGRPMAPIFRPPYGRRNAAVDAAAAAAGFPAIVMWDVSAVDATYTPRAAASIRAAIRGRSGSIVLLHAGPSLTPRILREIIRSYRGRGFGFVTIPDLLGLPGAASPASAPSGAESQHASTPDTCAGPVRSVDCQPDDSVTPAPPPGDDPGPEAAPAGVAAGAPTPAPRRTPVPVRPPVRASAWARSPAAETGVAAVTVGLLVALLVAGALLGGRGPRRRPRPAAPPPRASAASPGPGDC